MFLSGIIELQKNAAWGKVDNKFMLNLGLQFPVKILYCKAHYRKMTGGAPEVRSDKSLTLVTFNI